MQDHADSQGTSATPTLNSSGKPFRAMIARGAACDTCRKRKLKCDAARPHCAQCVKSARGDTSSIKCSYEGQGTIAKGAPGGRKRPRDSTDAGSNGDLSSTAHSPPEGDTMAHARKRTSGGQAASDGMAAGLMQRIAELESKLQIHSQPGSTVLQQQQLAFPDPSTSVTATPPQASIPPQSAYTAPSTFPPEFTMPDSRYTIGYAPSTAAPTREGRVLPMDEATARSMYPDHVLANMNGYSSASSYPPIDFQTSVPAQTQPRQALAPLPSPTSAAAALLGQFSHPMYQGVQQTSDKNAEATTAYSSFLNGSTTSEGTGNSFDLRSTTSPHASDVGTGSTLSAAASPDDLDASLLQLLYPGWSATLPPPVVVSHLVNTFFTRCAVPASIFSRSRFLGSLQYPPTSPTFPETALIHAMCGYAVALVSEDTLRSVTNGRSYWLVGADREATPRMYHYKQARKAIEEGIVGRRNVFQIVQAAILCCYIAYQNADFTDLWMLSGQMTRLCTPLQLNNIPPWDYFENKGSGSYPDWIRRTRGTDAGILGPITGRNPSLLAPVKDLDEYLERSKTFWAAFAIDRHVSAATDWSTSIDELDITTHLPCYTMYPGPELAIDRNVHMERIHSLSPRSVDFLSRTPAPIGSFGMYIKGNVLLGRVVNFLQRLPRFTRLPAGHDCATVTNKIKEQTEFKELDLSLAQFRTAMSADFASQETSGAIDGFLTSAFVLPHVATILLHEPFVTREDQSPQSSLAVMSRSAICIVNAMLLVYYSSSNDLSGTDPFLSFTWSVVGRALVRDYAVRRKWTDDEQQLAKADQSRDFARQCLAVMNDCVNRNKGLFGISVTIAQTLSDLLQDPDSLLPITMDEKGVCPITELPS